MLFRYSCISSIPPFALHVDSLCSATAFLPPAPSAATSSQLPSSPLSGTPLFHWCCLFNADLAPPAALTSTVLIASTLSRTATSTLLEGKPSGIENSRSCLLTRMQHQELARACLRYPSTGSYWCFLPVMLSSGGQIVQSCEFMAMLTRLPADDPHLPDKSTERSGATSGCSLKAKTISSGSTRSLICTILT